MIEGEETKPTATGTVEEVLPNSLFRVRLSSSANLSPEALPRLSEALGEGKAKGDEVEIKVSDEVKGELVLAYLAGKMRLYRIRVLVGDQVDMVLDPYGGRARIVRRLT